jgi:hypothetical protein
MQRVGVRARTQTVVEVLVARQPLPLVRCLLTTCCSRQGR